MDQTLITFADVPQARPDYGTSDMSAPVLVQRNRNGQWESAKPESLHVDRLRAVVQHLASSKVAQDYYRQCTAENKNNGGGKSNYVPVIMMPLYRQPAEQCPFNLENSPPSTGEKMKQTDVKPENKVKSPEVPKYDSDPKDDNKDMKNKRDFVMQRLNNFDLLSQW